MWTRFDSFDPPSGVVLAAVDSYDCGWVMDTAWWSREEACWFITGASPTTKAHMDYTHWCKLPEPPRKAK